VYRLLLLSNEQATAERIGEEFRDHTAYAVIPLSITALQHYTAAWDGCVVVGAVDERWLQQWNEQCRLAGKDIYQLAEGHFFEHTF